MSFQPDSPFAPERAYSVFAAHALRATSGVNLGDPIEDPAGLSLGDGYTLRSEHIAQTMHLAPVRGTPGLFRTTREDGFEAKGTAMRLTAQLTLMTQSGVTTDVLLITCDGPAARIYLSPTGPLAPAQEYLLLKVGDAPDTLPANMADALGLSFARGTRITLATGAQVPAEKLRMGQKVLTRDSGMQPIRWIGKRTMNAAGAFAPVVISPGALGNAEALIVAQTHRMMLSNWRAEVMTGSKDVLIEARDFLNGDTIHLREGGFVEYTQIAFDKHQILYAEGVTSESTRMTPHALATLPPEVRAALPPALQDPQSPARIELDATQARAFLAQTSHL